MWEFAVPSKFRKVESSNVCSVRRQASKWLTLLCKTEPHLDCIIPKTSINHVRWFLWWEDRGQWKFHACKHVVVYGGGSQDNVTWYSYIQKKENIVCFSLTFIYFTVWHQMKFISCIKAVMNKICIVFKYYRSMATVVIIVLHITILTNLRVIEEYLCFRNSI